MWNIDLRNFSEFRASEPVAEADLEKFSGNSNFQLPADYLQFLQLMNGGEGFVGDAFVRLYKVEELLEMNFEYKFQEFFPGFFLFGSDGAGEAFAFRMSDRNAIYQVPFIGQPKDAVRLAPSFSDWLEQLANSTQ